MGTRAFDASSHAIQCARYRAGETDAPCGSGQTHVCSWRDGVDDHSSAVEREWTARAYLVAMYSTAPSSSIFGRVAQTRSVRWKSRQERRVLKKEGIAPALTCRHHHARSALDILPGFIVHRLAHTQASAGSTPGGPGAGHNVRRRAAAHHAPSSALHHVWDVSERVPSRADPTVHRGASAAAPA